MHSLNVSDLLLSHMLTLGLSTLMLAALWWQLRERALGLWSLAFALQTIGILALLLRGSVFSPPVSVILSVASTLGGMLPLLAGLGRFFRVRVTFTLPLLAIASFVAVHMVFTFIAPNLTVRTSNLSLGLMTLCLFAVYVVQHQPDDDEHIDSSLLVGTLLAMAGISALRAVDAFGAPESPDMSYQFGLAGVALLAYQLATITLAVSLMLLVSQRMKCDLQRELAQHTAAETALRLSETRLSRAELAAKVGNWELHLETKTMVTSRGADAIYGALDNPLTYPTIRCAPVPHYRTLLDEALQRLIDDGIPYDIEFQIRTLDTSELKDIHSVASYDRDRRVVFGTITDITALKMQQRQLEHLAHFDSLTGLPNRSSLADRLDIAMAQCQRRQESLAVAFLDLDGFKSVNDQHGHDVGDALLVALTQRMKAALREGDTLARVGGDEFVAVLVDLTQTDDHLPVLDRLLIAASAPVAAAGHPLQVSASIGVTLFPADRSEAEILIRHADQAMYAAKKAGKNRYHLFNPATEGTP